MPEAPPAGLGGRFSPRAGAAGTVEVLVRRTASRSGRGRAFVNGALCTLGLLERCLAGAVDVTGQHEHVALLDEATHLGLLDAFAGAARHPERAGGGEESLVARYRLAHSALAAALRARDGARRRGRGAGAPRRLPRRSSSASWRRWGRSRARTRRWSGSDRCWSPPSGCASRPATPRRSSTATRGAAPRGSAGRCGPWRSAAALDPALEPTVALLRSALAEAEEAGRALARYADALGGDPERLAEVEERLEALRSLARKHGGSVGSALARAEAMRAELAEVESSGERLALLEGEMAAAGARAVALAAELSAVRSAAARDLAREVRRELTALAMGRCRVEVELQPPEQPLVHEGVALGADGAERARLMIAPNPGEPARPLARVASGGELSRVLLAAKRALARVDPCATYVFDEVDSGIGGAVAEAVGRLLAQVATDRQVVCVTHLPQVASHADHHYKVEKLVAGGRTTAAVRKLSPAEREEEVARMLAGATVTVVAREHARELIATARAGSPGAGHPGRASPTAILARVGREVGRGAAARRSQGAEHLGAGRTVRAATS